MLCDGRYVERVLCDEWNMDRVLCGGRYVEKEVCIERCVESVV